MDIYIRINRYSSLLFLFIAFSACSFTGGEQPTNIANTGNTTANNEVAASDAVGGESQAVRAERVVADLYKQHDAKKSPFFQTKDRASVDRYFAKELAELIWKDAVSSAGEIGALDADPLYYAQDIEIKNFKIWPAEIKESAANVKVTFSNYSENMSLDFSLELVNDNWKIANIYYGGKENLLAWLNSSPPARSGDELGDFRGKYIVGDTSCIVEYKNKGYAVKWAKGSGLEYFSFMDGTTFASSTVESEANRFVFDNENYDTGTFYRADGKTFPVRRAK